MRWKLRFSLETTAWIVHKLYTGRFPKKPNQTKQPTSIDNWPPSRLIQCVLLLFILSFVEEFPTFLPCQLPLNFISEYISPLRYLSFQRVVLPLWLLFHLKIKQTGKNGLLVRKSQDRGEVFTTHASRKRNRPDSERSIRLHKYTFNIHSYTKSTGRCKIPNLLFL